jgi:hypothetical protein
MADRKASQCCRVEVGEGVERVAFEPESLCSRIEEPGIEVGVVAH